MPRPLKLAQEQVDDLLVFASLSEHEVDSLVRLFGAIAAPPLTPTQFRKAVAAALPRSSRDQVDRLLRQFLYICRLRASRGWSPDALTAAIADALGDYPEAQKHLSGREAAIAAVASARAMQVFAKALDITYEHENLCQTVRIMMDIRPVFSPDASSVEASVIAYTLHVRYYGHNGPRTISVAMDHKDVEALALQCDRAKRKGDVALALMAQRAGVPTTIAGVDEDI